MRGHVSSRPTLYIWVFSLFFLLSFAADEGDFSRWKGRALYQIVTDRLAPTPPFRKTSQCTGDRRCGGTWAGIQAQLDYIQGMGFDAIGISSVLDNLENGWHGYWTRDFNSLESQFGSTQDLQSLLGELRARNMRILFDVNLNHIGPVSDLKGSQIQPFKKDSDYHDSCSIVDWGNWTQVVKCRVGTNLRDLDHDSDSVKKKLVKICATLGKDWTPDGFRLNYAINIDSWFLSYLQEQLPERFLLGQVNHPMNHDVRTVARYSYLLGGVMNYPLYFALQDVFAAESTVGLQRISEVLSESLSRYADPDLVVNFLDTDDTPRASLTIPDSKFMYSALAVVLTSRGIPCVFYGTEQQLTGDRSVSGNRPSLWGASPQNDTNAPFYRFIRQILTHRSGANYALASHTDVYVDSDFYVYLRGESLLVAVTRLKASNLLFTVPANLASVLSDGTIFSSLDGSHITTVTTGKLRISFDGGMPRILKRTKAGSSTSSTGTTGAGTSTGTSTGVGSGTTTTGDTTTGDTGSSSSSEEGTSSSGPPSHLGIALGLTLGLAVPIAIVIFLLIAYFYLKRKRYTDLDGTSPSGAANNSEL